MDGGIIGAIGSSTSEDAETRSEVQAASNRRACPFTLKTSVKKCSMCPECLPFISKKKHTRRLCPSKIVRGGIHQLEDGHYEMPLPLRNENVELPNSKKLALSRLTQLKRGLTSDAQFPKDYCTSWRKYLVVTQREFQSVRRQKKTQKWQQFGENDVFGESDRNNEQ